MYGSNSQTNQKSRVLYLRHQWSDEAHTLQFCSTVKYSETIEYEPQTPTHVRDIIDNLILTMVFTMQMLPASNIFSRFWGSRWRAAEYTESVKSPIPLKISLGVASICLVY